MLDGTKDPHAYAHKGWCHVKCCFHRHTLVWGHVLCSLHHGEHEHCGCRHTGSLAPSRGRAVQVFSDSDCGAYSQLIPALAKHCSGTAPMSPKGPLSSTLGRYMGAALGILGWGLLLETPQVVLRAGEGHLLRLRPGLQVQLYPLLGSQRYWSKNGC